MMNIPDAIGISVFEMNLYQKNLALLQEKCASMEFQQLFPEPFGDKDLFAYTISYRYEVEYPNDLTDWRPKKIRMVTLGNDAH